MIFINVIVKFFSVLDKVIVVFCELISVKKLFVGVNGILVSFFNVLENVGVKLVWVFIFVFIVVFFWVRVWIVGCIEWRVVICCFSCVDYVIRFWFIWIGIVFIKCVCFVL